MGRLVALVCNDPDRLACALAPVRDALQAGTPAASGVGSYQGGDVLLRRRPTTSGSHVDFFDVVHGLRTDTFIAHARTPTVGAVTRKACAWMNRALQPARASPK